MILDAACRSVDSGSEGVDRESPRLASVDDIALSNYRDDRTRRLAKDQVVVRIARVDEVEHDFARGQCERRGSELEIRQRD